MSKHSIELTAAHVAGLARMVPGAYSVTFDNHGEITIQGSIGELDGAPEALGLERTPKRDHVNGASEFRLWSGITRSAFGAFETRLVMTGPVESPSDCYTVEFT